MADLVNGIYPLEYFLLENTDTIEYPDTTWWSSRQRYAAVDSMNNYLPVAAGGTQTTEYLEIDLGRVRQLNYINFDVIRAPIDISIEYCAAPDGRSVWVPVAPLTNMSFENAIFFDGNNRTMWQNVDYYFTDPLGNIVNARFVRFGFTRRDEHWPVVSAPPFPWPVFVKHLRTGRYISGPEQTIGPIVNHDNTPNVNPLTLPNEVREVRQQFVFPTDAARGTIVPKITGVGVLTEPTADHTNAAIGWSIWDVTDPGTPVILREGTQQGLTVNDRAWSDIYLPVEQWIDGDITKTYEARFTAQTPELCNTFFTTTNNRLSVRPIPGTLSFIGSSTSVTTSVDTRATVLVGSMIANSTQPTDVYTVNAVTSGSITLNRLYSGATASGQIGQIIYPLTTWDGSYTPSGATNLIARVWSNTADSGRDVLGNTYRHGLRTQEAAAVTDSNAPGWMSAPKPSPDAVEALYFDVRALNPDTKELAATVIDALEIDPRTPGVRMNIYYSRQGGQGETPSNQAEWDFLLWTPVAHNSYTLRRHQTIDFPTPIYATFIKLEFTGLRPQPYALPNFPPLPPVIYNRFPTWVETQFQNAQVRTAVQDWFLRNATPVQVNALRALADPVQEFAYEQQALFAAIASGQVSTNQVSSGIVINKNTVIDPVTASQIYLTDTSAFQSSLLVSVDQTSVLGAAVVSRYSPALVNTPTEVAWTPRASTTVPTVSSTNNRLSESYQTLAQVPMRFNRTCRHLYLQEQGTFNKKAYFVGIQSIIFRRANKGVTRDDTLFWDDLYDDRMLQQSTWARDAATDIPDHSTLYVSYEVAEEQVQDEVVILNGNVPATLQLAGGPASDVLVFTSPNRQGTQYFQTRDYELAYATVNARRVNLLFRAPSFNRLVIPEQTVDFRDAGIVMAVGIIPQPPIIEAGSVTAVGLVFSSDAPLEPSYGLGTYGSVGATYADLRGYSVDAGSVTAVGVPSGVTRVSSVDASTVTAQGSSTGVVTLIRKATIHAVARIA